MEYSTNCQAESNSCEPDFDLEEKYYDAVKNGVQIFFIRVQDRFRAYRIIKEEAANAGLKQINKFAAAEIFC